MPGIRIYLDEDSLDRRLRRALDEQDCDVLTAVQAGRASETDEAQLLFAASEGRMVFTSNQADFARLHAQFMRAGRGHAGIVICTFQGLAPEQQARRLVAAVSGRNMADACAFIGRGAPRSQGHRGS